MKVYTKTGDKGKTSLIGGEKVYKDEAQIEAYGTVDELNSYLGLVRDHDEIGTSDRDFIISVQNDLFAIGSLLAESKKKNNMKLPQITEEMISNIEKKIDEIELQLEPMRFFVLPGGHKLISHLHITRCICRRAERRIVTLSNQIEVSQIILKYVNRLSDYIFILSRYIALKLDIKETPWLPKK